MNFSDIIALAKNGYSPKDIKDLIQLATEVEAEETPEEGKADTDALEESKTEDTGTEHKEEPKADTETAELQQQLDDLRKQLEIAQRANINRNVEKEKESDRDIIDSAFRNLLE